MSVVLSFQICQSGDCSSLQFSELTGAYDAISNLTGWGSPNSLISDALTATLTITLADSSSYTIDLFATGNFPTTSSTIYDIINTDIGLVVGDVIPDQIITFTYTVTTASATYTQTNVQAFYCQAECCVNSMFLDLDFDCDCSKDSIDLALKAYAMLQGLKMAANSGNRTNYNNILAQINKLCANSSCSNCK